MKNLKLFFVLAGILFTINSKAQTPLPIDLVYTKSLITACAENLFTANLHIDSTQRITIKARTTNASSCTEALTNSVIIVPVLPAAGITISSPVIDTVQGTYTATFAANNANVTFSFHVYIDCDVISSGGSSNLSTNLSLRFTDPNNIYLYDVDTTSSDSIYITPILLPDIVDNSPIDYTVYHGDTLNIYNYYKNSGGGGILNATFSFLTDASNYCNQLTPLSLMYRTTGTNFTTLTGNPNITLAQGDTLVIRRQMLDSLCISSCTTAKSVFKWQCAYNAGSSTLSSVTCATCKDSIISPYQVENSTDSVKTERLLPTPAVFYDLTCMNDTANMVTWQYRITKPNPGAADSLIVDLKSAANTNSIQSLSLIPVSSLVVYADCISCMVDTLIIDLATTSLCGQYIPQAVASASLLIRNFNQGDTIVVTFRTLKCAYDTTALLNVGKYYNQWQFIVKAKTICDLAAKSFATSNTYPFSGPPDYTTANSYIDRLTTTVPNIDQKLLFIPTVSNLIVPADSLFGDYATMDVELKGMFRDPQLAGCTTSNCTLKGYIRATVHCDVGLRINIDSLASAAKFSYFNFSNGTTVYKYPEYYHTAVPGDSCVAGDYYFYYNLNDSNMRNMLDAGLFSYTLQACCGGADQSPYSVSFHAMLNPNGNCAVPVFPSIPDTAGPTYSSPNYAWLPLSSAGDIIESQCPGCFAVGVIAENYRMYRTSYGLQSSLNNGIADSAQIITPGSTWYNAYASQLKPQHSTFGDLVEDVFTARFQDGDNSNNIGYTYAQMTNTNANAILHYLQLAREIPKGLDTAKLTPYEFTLYIDLPDTSGTPNCINCNQFKTIGTNFRTQQIITVAGNDIQKYLSQLTVQNILFFSFSTFGTTGNLTGNLHNTAALADTASSIWTDSISPFTGFTPFQLYRLKVKYRENGIFTTNVALPSVTDVSKRAAIKNRVWFSGDSLAYDAWSTHQMPNTVAAADSMGWSFNSSDTNYISQQFADSFAFWCEFTGGFHTFFSQEARNNAQYFNDATCTKRLAIGFTTTIARDVLNAFPYEYKPASLWAQQYNVTVPPGYQIDSAYSRVWAYNGQNNLNTSVPFTTPQNTGNFIFNDNILSQPHCYFTGSTPSATNQLVKSSKTGREIVLYINPDNCKNDTGVVIPADTSLLAKSTVITSFNKITYPCFAPNTSALGQAFIDTIHPLSSPVKLINKPNLSVTYDQNLVANTRIICDTITITNYALSLPQISTAANNLFIALPTAQTVNWFTNWQFIYKGDTILPIGNNIIPISAQLAKDSVISNALLCANFTTCVDSPSFNFLIGWSCDTFPTATADSATFCGYIQRPVSITKPSEGLQAAKQVPDSFGLCKPFQINAQFTSTQIGSFYPDSVKLLNLAPHLQVQQITISPCNDSIAIDTLQGTGLTRNITLNNMVAINFNDGGFSNAQCLQINVTLLPQCGFQDDIYLPSIKLYSKNFCGDTTTTTATFAPDDSITLLSPGLIPDILWDSSSACSDCFTLSKIANADTVAIGDTVTFTIQVCSHNGGPDTIQLTETLPSSTVFTLISATPPFPINNTNFLPDTCINYIVKGKYKAAGSCPNTLFTNKVTLQSGMATYIDSVCVSVIDLCANTDTIFPDSTFSAATTNTTTIINSKSIFVAGRYYVRNTLNLNNCTVYTAAGAQIIIEATGILNTNNTTIQACDTMWQGITVLTDGEVNILNNSTIKDANIAVFADHPSAVTVDSSKIFDCVMGIYVPPSTGLTNTQIIVKRSEIGLKAAAFRPDYTGQPTHGATPKNGIEVNNIIMTLGGTYGKNNQLYKMNNGIVAHNSQITVTRTKFFDIRIDSAYTETYRGYAMVCQKPVLSDLGISKLTVLPEVTSYNTVNNCYRGIYTKGTILYANYVHLLNVNTGVYCEAAPWLSTNMVTNCTITASTHGLFFVYNPLARFVALDYNTITITGVNNPSSMFQTSRYAIHMRESYFGIVNYSASSNIITMSNAQFGIYSGLLNRASIKFNNIRFTGNGSGISAQSNFRSSVSCNSVTGNYASSALGGSNGINIGNLSISTLMYCNSVDSTSRGVYFGGINPNTYMLGTEFYHHFNGLYLNSSSNISPQTHFGNRWNNQTSSFQAENANISGYVNSRFFVDSLLSSTYKPINNIPGVGGWFQPNDGNTFICSNTMVCSTPPPALSTTELDEMIADGSLASVDYAVESQAIAEEYLYRALEEDSTLILEDSAYVQFVLDNAEEATGYLYDVEEYLRAASEFDTVYINLSDSAYQQIAILNDSIAYLEAYVPSNWEVIREQLIYKVNFLNQTINNIQVLRETMLHGNLQDAELANDMVVPDNLPEENAEYINDIEIHFQDEYSIEYLRENYEGILAIASQCPYAGGSAVEKARGLIALLNQEIFYDDDNVCLQSGMYRTASKDSVNINLLKAINIQPNPASTSVTISLIGKFEGVCNIQIKNTLGETVLIKQMNCEESVDRLDISKIASGFYTIKVSVNNSNFVNAKLIVVR